MKKHYMAMVHRTQERHEAALGLWRRFCENIEGVCNSETFGIDGVKIPAPKFDNDPPRACTKHAGTSLICEFHFLGNHSLLRFGYLKLDVAEETFVEAHRNYIDALGNVLDRKDGTATMDSLLLMESVERVFFAGMYTALELAWSRVDAEEAS